jgi:hypothetical protein
MTSKVRGKTSRVAEKELASEIEAEKGLLSESYRLIRDDRAR